MGTVNLANVTNGIIDCLRAYHPADIGDGAVPGEGGNDQLDRLAKGYVVVVPSASKSLSEGIQGERMALATVHYQIRGVGVGRRHAEMHTATAMEILSDLDPSDGEYLYPLAVAGCNVQLRRRGVAIPLMREGSVFNAGQFFEVTVAAT